MTGGMSINLDTWNSLPEDVQHVIADLGKEYSAAEAAEVSARYQRSLDQMKAEGATVTELPAAEKQKWIDGLPNIASQWVAANEARGIPAGKVLRAYMNAVRSRGGKPLRNWDLELEQK